MRISNALIARLLIAVPQFLDEEIPQPHVAPSGFALHFSGNFGAQTDTE
jgi:hypothetical protein